MVGSQGIRVVLVLPEWVAPDPPTKPALKSKFNWVVLLVPPGGVAPNLPTKLALKPKFNWLVGCKLALKPKFCCLPSTPGGANMTSCFASAMLMPIAAMGVLPGDAVIVLAFAAAAVAMAAIGIPLGDKWIALCSRQLQRWRQS
jgi:hypothetical protein